MGTGSVADAFCVEKGDRHRAGKILGGFGIDCSSEPVPLFHSARNAPEGFLAPNGKSARIDGR